MYYRKGQVVNFTEILSEALKEHDFDQRLQHKHLYDNNLQRVRALNILASHQLHAFESECGDDSKQ